MRVAVSLIVLIAALSVAPSIADAVATTAGYLTCMPTVSLFVTGLILTGSGAYVGYLVGRYGCAPE